MIEFNYGVRGLGAWNLYTKKHTGTKGYFSDDREEIYTKCTVIQFTDHAVQWAERVLQIGVLQGSLNISSRVRDRTASCDWIQMKKKKLVYYRYKNQ